MKSVGYTELVRNGRLGCEEGESGMRLDKLLSETGYGSRKDVKRLIRGKQVRIDGKVVLTDNYNVDPQLQLVVVAGKTVSIQSHVYYMLHKPAGVVTAVSDADNRTVIDLIDPADRMPGLYPVGRLDKDTEGLLLITDNGQLGYQLLLPHKKVMKRYEALVNERVTGADQEAFAEGIVFHGGERCKPAKLTILSQGEAGEPSPAGHQRGEIPPSEEDVPVRRQESDLPEDGCRWGRSSWMQPIAGWGATALCIRKRNWNC